MAKVYITNKGGHDYSAAEKFGELVFCTKGSLPRFNTAQMFRELSQAMKDSSPDDYILITSLASLNSVACALFAHKHGRLNLLLWQPDEGSKGKYVERTILFDNGDKHEQGSEGTTGRSVGEVREG